DKNELAAAGGHCGPASVEDSAFEGGGGAQHLVGGKELVRPQPFDQRLIELVEVVARKLFGPGQAGDAVVLCVHGDEYGGMPLVCVGPGFQLAQAGGQRKTAAAEVDVLDVHDLEAGLQHLSFRVVGEVVRGLSLPGEAPWVRVFAPA